MFLIDLLFKIFHLFLFIFLGVYFYRKYYQKDLTEKIEQEKLEAKILIEKNINTEQTINSLAEQLVKQQEQCELLIEKVKFWKKSVDKFKKAEALKKEELLETIAQKRTVQFNNYFNFKLESELLPEVIEEVKRDLEKKYKSKENQNKYVDTILEFINNNGAQEKNSFLGKNK